MSGINIYFRLVPSCQDGQSHIPPFESLQLPEVNNDALQRILELEHNTYKLNNKISVLENKLKRKDEEVVNLRNEVKKLRMELKKKNEESSAQMNQTTLSVGFLIYSIEFSLRKPQLYAI